MIRLLPPKNNGPMVSLSRWDLLHLLYSVDHRPTSEHDRKDLDAVFLRACRALQ